MDKYGFLEAHEMSPEKREEYAKIIEENDFMAEGPGCVDFDLAAARRAGASALRYLNEIGVGSEKDRG